ncbi:MAG TPA: nickel insertion protein, partial [Gemmatimonadales bacterium]|nr:nickel insertion protein [Gemmatimonadales bacterium]
QMKKGRPGFRVEVVAPEGEVDPVTAALFRHSTTAGVRRWSAERATLERRQVTVQLSPDVAVRVKVLEQSDGVRVKPEYDDVLAAAARLGRPPLDVARAAARDAESLVAKSKERG